MTAAKRGGATRAEDVTARLRNMILRGDFVPGQRVPEIELASTLEVSRTPVRVALGVLAAEGLLEGAPNRGFSVRSYTDAHVFSSFDVRGALEGLAARTTAERGLDRAPKAQLLRSLEDTADLAERSEVNELDVRRWAAANDLFHRTLVASAGLPALDDVYQHFTRLPLTSPVAILFRSDRSERALLLIRQSHAEHAQVFDAVVRGEGARAEALIKEHAYRSRQNIQMEKMDMMVSATPLLFG